LITANASTTTAQDQGLTNTAPVLAFQHRNIRDPAAQEKSQFSLLIEEAMIKMMADMTTSPTTDVDRDFVMMMVPHHQGAIDMAMAVLQHGRNEKIRRLAHEIIVTQQQEIAAMKLAISE
jgi:uncharacterized protein (DUF305 family)